MDPTACLRRIAMATGRRERREACEDLSRWLGMGGSAPDWAAWPEGAQAYLRWCGRKAPEGAAQA